MHGLLPQLHGLPGERTGDPAVSRFLGARGRAVWSLGLLGKLGRRSMSVGKSDQQELPNGELKTARLDLSLGWF